LAVNPEAACLTRAHFVPKRAWEIVATGSPGSGARIGECRASGRLGAEPSDSTLSWSVSIRSVVVHHVGFRPESVSTSHRTRASTLLSETSAPAELRRPSSTLRRTRPQPRIGRIAPHKNSIRSRRPPPASALSGFRAASRPKQERSCRPGRERLLIVCVRECVRKRDSTKQHHMDDPARTWSRPETGESRFRRSQARQPVRPKGFEPPTF